MGHFRPQFYLINSWSAWQSPEPYSTDKPERQKCHWGLWVVINSACLPPEGTVKTGINTTDLGCTSKPLVFIHFKLQNIQNFTIYCGACRNYESMILESNRFTNFLEKEIEHMLFVDLVADDILQMALVRFTKKSLGEEYYITLTNTICCTFKQLAVVPLSTKRNWINSIYRLVCQAEK